MYVAISQSAKGILFFFLTDKEAKVKGAAAEGRGNWGPLLQHNNLTGVLRIR